MYSCIAIIDIRIFKIEKIVDRLNMEVYIHKNNWIVLIPKKHITETKLRAQEIAKELDSYVYYFFYNSDGWGYEIYKKGILKAQFSISYNQRKALFMNANVSLLKSLSVNEIYFMKFTNYLKCIYNNNYENAKAGPEIFSKAFAIDYFKK